MAALDRALRRAEQAAEWLGWRGRAATPPSDGTGRRIPDRRNRSPTPDAAALSVVSLPPIKGGMREFG